MTPTRAVFGPAASQAPTRVRARAIGLALGGAAFGIGLLSVVTSWHAPGSSFVSSSPLASIAFLAAGWGAVTAGIVSRAGGRRRRFGLTLVASGFAWLVSPWVNPTSGSPLLFTIGLALGAAYPAVLTHALLLYRRDRLEGRWMPMVVLVGYLICLGPLGIGVAVSFDTEASLCGLCPDNFAALISAPALAEASIRIGIWAAAAWAPIAAVSVASTLHSASPAWRQRAAPALVPGIVLLGFTSAGMWYSLGPGIPQEDGVAQTLRLAEALSLVGIAIGIGVDRLWSRRARSRLARVVADLRSARPGGLREALALEFGDENLAIAYPIADGSMVDVHGRSVPIVDRPGRRRMSVVQDGSTIAMLELREELADEVDVEGLMATAGLGFAHERLLAEAVAQLQELRRSRAEVIQAADAERMRLERDLHDGSQQRVIGLSIALRLLARSLGVKPDDASARKLAQGEEEVRAALDQLRRIAHGLYPAILTDEGLAAALEGLVENSQRPLEATVLLNERLAQQIETTAYDVIALAVQDDGDAPVTIAVTRSASGVMIDLHGVAPARETLEDIGDRVGAADGRVVMLTESTLRAEIPCAS